MCDHPKCRAQADMICVLCGKDLCPAHTTIPTLKALPSDSASVAVVDLISITQGFCAACNFNWGVTRLVLSHNGEFPTDVFDGVWEAMKAMMQEQDLSGVAKAVMRSAFMDDPAKVAVEKLVNAYRVTRAEATAFYNMQDAATKRELCWEEVKRP
jgi:hypothetical protein